MRIMVTGSRRWTDKHAIYLALLPFLADNTQLTLIHGGAVGADALAGEVFRAESRGFDGEYTVEVFKPLYRKGDDAWNRQAPLRRNDEMLATKPDVVLAFLLGQPEHGGTRYTITRAQGLGIPVWIVNHPELEEGSVQADEGAAA